MKKHPKVHRHGRKWRVKFSFSKEKYVITADSEQECIELYQQKIQSLQTPLIPDCNPTFVEVADDYYEQYGSHLKSCTQIYHTLQSFIRGYPFICHIPIQNITPKQMIAWRNDRLSKVKHGTVRTEMGRLFAVFNHAIHEMQVLKENPLESIKKPKSSNPRKRRVSQMEVEHLVKCCKYQLGTRPKNNLQIAVWCFIFAIKTCMRVGEILSITRANLYPTHVHLPITKNGTSRDVPLTEDALSMLSWLNMGKLGTEEGLFGKPFKVKQVSEAWIRLTKKARIHDLHFHDSRHEGISRFVHDYRLPVETLAKITGHKDLRVLLNTYYNPTVTEMLSMMKTRFQTPQYPNLLNHYPLDPQDTK